MNFIIKNKNMRILFFCFLSLMILRLSLPYIIQLYAHYKLNSNQYYSGSIKEVKINFLKGNYQIFDLLIQKQGKDNIDAFVSVKEIQVTIDPKKLFGLSLISTITIKEPNFYISGDLKKIISETDIEIVFKQLHDGWIHFKKVFNELFPVKLDHFLVENGQFHFHDPTLSPKMEFSFTEMRIEGNNFTNSLKLSETLFSTFNISSKIMNEGKTEIKLLLNPVSNFLEMQLNTKLSRFNLVDLNPYLDSFFNFDIKKGYLSFYSEIAIADNKIEGYAKPIIDHLKVSKFSEDKKQGISHALFEKTIGAVAGILKNHPKNRQALKVPISGKLNTSSVDLWGTLTSILKNIFIKPIHHELEGSVDLNDLKKNK